jgi:hypothetical protein
VKLGRPSSFLSLAVRETCRCLPVTTNLANEYPLDMFLFSNRLHTHPRQHNQKRFNKSAFSSEKLFQHRNGL